MAKCKALTGLAVKGLKTGITMDYSWVEAYNNTHPMGCVAWKCLYSRPRFSADDFDP